MVVGVRGNCEPAISCVGADRPRLVSLEGHLYNDPRLHLSHLLVKASARHADIRAVLAAVAL